MEGSPGKLDPRYAELVQLASAIARDRLDPDTAPPDGSDELDLAIGTLRELSTLIEQNKAAQTESETRLNTLMDMIVSLLGFDYTRRVPVTDDDTIFDGMAVGLNMLAEELATSTVSKAYANDIIESMSDLLIVMGPDGVIKTANQAACTLSGYSREELVGQPMSLLFPDIVDAESAGADGEREQEKMCHRKGDGTTAVSFSAAAMIDNHSVLRGVVCVGHDLTSAKLAEAERMRLYEAVNRQSIILEELSTPLIPVTKDILVLPLIGSVDEARAKRMVEALLAGIVERQAKVAIIDITGVRAVNAAAVDGIMQAVRAVRLIGADVVLTGIRPSVARTVLELDLDLGGIVTFGTLQRGILHAMQRANDRNRRASNG
jgi:rsbT co-antagonist protein RsbR